MAAMNKKVSNKQKKDTLMFHLMLLIPVIILFIYSLWNCR